MLFLLHVLSNISPAQINNETDENNISINTYTNIDIEGIVKGTKKNSFMEDQIILFEIRCQQNRSIRITRTKDAGNDYVKFETEWRAGANNGLEELFCGDAVYRCDNNIFFVTMTIKSIEVLNIAPSGEFSFTPEISVEYIDI